MWEWIVTLLQIYLLSALEPPVARSLLWPVPLGNYRPLLSPILLYDSTLSTGKIALIHGQDRGGGGGELPSALGAIGPSWLFTLSFILRNQMLCSER